MATEEEKALVSALLGQGKSDFEAERWDAAKSTYLQTLALIEDRGFKTKWNFEVREYIAECEHRLDEFSHAMNRNEETLRLLAMQTSDYARESIPRIRYNLARNLEAMETTFESKEARNMRFRRAERLHQENMQLGEDVCGVRLFQNTRLHLASINQKLGRYLTAEQLYGNLVAGTEALDRTDLEWVCAVMHGHSAALYSLGRYPESERGFLQLKQILMHHVQNESELKETKSRSLRHTVQDVDKFLVNCASAIAGVNRRLPAGAIDRKKNGCSPRVDFGQDVASNQAKYKDNSCPDVSLDSRHQRLKRRFEAHSESEARPMKRRKYQTQVSQKRLAGRRPKQILGSKSGALSVGRDTPESSDHSEQQLKAEPRPQSCIPVLPDLQGIEVRGDVQNSVQSTELIDSFALQDKRDGWFYKLQKHTHAMLYSSKYPEGEKPRRKRVRIALIDTGVDLDHMKGQKDFGGTARALSNAIQDYKDFAGNEDWVDTGPDFHGTRCAALIRQTAPQAELFIANVRSKEGIRSNNVARALTWAANEKKVDIVSMSFGWEHEQTEVAIQLEIGRDKMLFFAAASNDGDIGPELGVYPARDSTVFCVHSCDSSLKPSRFTPSPYPDRFNWIFPGEDITILNTACEPIAGFGRFGGTSFATPIAAGTAALVLDLARQQLDDSLPEVERCMKEHKGMASIFRSMSHERNGYFHVKPWEELGLFGPPEIPEYAGQDKHSRQRHALTGILKPLKLQFSKPPRSSFRERKS